MNQTPFFTTHNEPAPTPQATKFARETPQRQSLDALVRRVIRNELSEQEQLLVRLYWYRGKTKDEIAALTGADRKTVARRLEHCRKILYDHLKYTVEFQFSAPEAQRAKEAIQNAGQNTLAIAALDGIGDRLTQYLQQRRLSAHEVMRRTGIAPARLQSLQQDGRQMMMTELSSLCDLLHVSVNSLLFGEMGKEYPN